MSDHLTMPSELTIYTVGECHPRFLAWLASACAQVGEDSDRDRDEDFDVHAADVDEIDAAGVQLLLSLAHALSRARRRLRLHNPSQRLVNACQALGASVLLAHAVHDSGAGCETDQPLEAQSQAAGASAGAPA